MRFGKRLLTNEEQLDRPFANVERWAMHRAVDCANGVFIEVEHV